MRASVASQAEVAREVAQEIARIQRQQSNAKDKVAETQGAQHVQIQGHAQPSPQVVASGPLPPLVGGGATDQVRISIEAQRLLAEARRAEAGAVTPKEQREAQEVEKAAEAKAKEAVEAAEHNGASRQVLPAAKTADVREPRRVEAQESFVKQVDVGSKNPPTKSIPPELVTSSNERPEAERSTVTSDPSNGHARYAEARRHSDVAPRREISAQQAPARRADPRAPAPHAPSPAASPHVRTAPQAPAPDGARSVEAQAELNVQASSSAGSQAQPTPASRESSVSIRRDATEHVEAARSTSQPEVARRVEAAGPERDLAATSRRAARREKSEENAARKAETATPRGRGSKRAAV